jgi:hypothetical protein
VAKLHTLYCASSTKCAMCMSMKVVCPFQNPMCPAVLAAPPLLHSTSSAFQPQLRFTHCPRSPSISLIRSQRQEEQVDICVHIKCRWIREASSLHHRQSCAAISLQQEVRQSAGVLLQKQCKGLDDCTPVSRLDPAVGSRNATKKTEKSSFFRTIS